MMYRKLKGFTVAEILIVLTIIGIISAITVSSTIRSHVVSSKKQAISSKEFYTEASNGYMSFLTRETDNFDVRKTKDLPPTQNIQQDTNVFASKFAKYIEFDRENNCNKLRTLESTKHFKKEGLVCGTTSKGTIVGLYLNRNCQDTYQVLEYFQEISTNYRTLENVCGYIIYQFRTSKGSLGVDTFVIPLGKRGVR